MSEQDLLSLSYKDSKSDLWSAYKQMKTMLGQKKSGALPLAEPTKPAKTSPDWQQEVLGIIKNLDLQFQEKKEALASLEEQVAETKEELQRSHQIEIKAQTLEELEEKIKALEALSQRRKKQLEEDFEQEKAWRQKRLDREEEEKRFGLKLKRRRVEQQLEQKDYQQLQQEIAKFPKILEQEKQKIEKETAARLEKDFEQEKTLLTQEHQSSKKLLEQQIANLEMQAKNQGQEIAGLNGQLNSAHQKIKEMAIAALEIKKSGSATEN